MSSRSWCVFGFFRFLPGSGRTPGTWGLAAEAWPIPSVRLSGGGDGVSSAGEGRSIGRPSYLIGVLEVRGNFSPLSFTSTVSLRDQVAGAGHREVVTSRRGCGLSVRGGGECRIDSVVGSKSFQVPRRRAPRPDAQSASGWPTSFGCATAAFNFRWNER